MRKSERKQVRKLRKMDKEYEDQKESNFLKDEPEPEMQSDSEY